MSDDDIPMEEVAEFFGRTIEACRQHRYELLWAEREGRNRLRSRYASREKEEYVPIPAGPDEDAWWDPAYYTKIQA